MEKEGIPFMEAIVNGKLKGRLSRDAAIACTLLLGLDIRIDEENQ